MEVARAKSLYITSTIHDEGKTRILADIGVQLARLGKKTLLIDCDLANPRLGALFYNDLKYEQTLNSLYRGDSDKIDAILHVNGCLDLLPTVLERNPEDINDPLLNVIKGVMEDYDYVLIDAAPIGVNAEVLRLNEVTDTVLYVVRYDNAKLDDIKRSILRIAKSGIPVVGAVFNCVVNWRQTIINSPKRLTAAINREKKKREKQAQREAEYQEKLQKREEMEKRPDRRYLDGIAPASSRPSPPPASAAPEKKGWLRRKPEKEESSKPMTETAAPQTDDAITQPAAVSGPAPAEPLSKRRRPEKKAKEEPARDTEAKKSKSQKIAQRKAAEKQAKEQAAAKKAAKKQSKKK